MNIYYQYIVQDVTAVTDTIYRVMLLPNKEKLKFLPGQYIKCMFNNYKSGSYSIANYPNKNGAIELHIRSRDPNTSMLTYILAHKNANLPVTLMGPYGKIFFNQQEKENILYVAKGVGVTPFLSMLKAALLVKFDKKIFLSWVVSPEDNYVAHFLNDCQKELPCFSYSIVDNETYLKCFNIGMLNPNKIKAYISGSHDFYKMTIKQLSRLGVKKECIYSDL